MHCMGLRRDILDVLLVRERSAGAGEGMALFFGLKPAATQRIFSLAKSLKAPGKRLRDQKRPWLVDASGAVNGSRGGPRLGTAVENPWGGERS